MIGSLIRWGLLTTLVGGSAVAFVGKDQVRLYLAEGKQTVTSALEEMRGMEGRLKLIRTQLRGLDDETRDLKTESVRCRVETERLQGEIAQRERDLDRRRSVLEKASGLLAENRDRYQIGGVSYARADVERDAAQKLEVFNVQQDTLKSLRETLATKEKALEIAAQNVARAAQLRVELQAKVGLLEAQLQKYRAKEAFAATVDDVVSTKEIDSDLARAREMIASFERDLEVKDRMLDESMRSSADAPGEGIDYEPKVQGEELSVLLRRALGRPEPDAVAVTSPTVSARVASVVVPIAVH